MARRISNIGYAQLHLPPTLELEAEAWSKQGWTGVTQTTHDLLSYWFNRNEDDLPRSIITLAWENLIPAGKVLPAI